MFYWVVLIQEGDECPRDGCWCLQNAMRACLNMLLWINEEHALVTFLISRQPLKTWVHCSVIRSPSPFYSLLKIDRL